MYKRFSIDNYKDVFKVATKVNFSGPYSSTDDPKHTEQNHLKHHQRFEKIHLDLNLISFLK